MSCHSIKLTRKDLGALIFIICIALCMDQFRVLFGTTRVPVGNGVKDYVHHYPDSSHVVVLIKNHIYYFQALWPHDGSVAVDQHDIKDILEAIQKHVDYLSCSKDRDGQDSNTKGVPRSSSEVEVDGKKVAYASCDEALGVLTSLPRNEWAAARRMITEGGDLKNKAALEIIDSALFVLVLDDHEPTDIASAAKNMLHGSHKLVLGENGRLEQSGSLCNRWYDKLQLIVMANGKAGVNFEHSAIDGHTALRYVSDIFAENVVQVSVQKNEAGVGFFYHFHSNSILLSSVCAKYHSLDLWKRMDPR